jgi:hypothetical protein
VPSAPAKPTVAPNSRKGVNVSWSAPASNGSAITGYKVFRGTTSTSLSQLTTLGNVTSYRDSSTTRGRTYYYQVSAINAIAEGPRSPVSNAVVAR